MNHKAILKNPLPIGYTTGRLTVLSAHKTELRGGRIRHFYKCYCTCGVIQQSVEHYQLKLKKVVSCGCFMREVCRKLGLLMATHGEGRHGHCTTEYRIWTGIKARCFNPNDKAYKWYGGRGITMCDRWNKSFEDFLKDIGRRPSALYSLDRYPNNDGNYEPGNVRWATDGEQIRNSRVAHNICFNGQTKCIAEWASSVNISHGALYQRISSGWNIEKALNTPLKITVRTKFITKRVDV